MKLTTFLLIIALAQVSAKGYSQITLKAQRASLANVLKTIKKQTGYVFITGDIDLSKQQVDINVNNVSINKALDECFKNTQLDYKIVDKTVVIERKEPTVIDKIKAIFQLSAIDVRGKIVDSLGQSIPGATIIVKGGSNSTRSDERGFFSLKKVEANATLVVSSIGYEKREITAREELGDIKLQVSINKLDQVQVIAYGQTTERLSTGNIATISGNTIAQQPVLDPILALQGRVTGLVIKQSNGFAGGGVSVQIQGQNSIGNGNTPLYVVDGVPYASDLPSNINSVQRGVNTTNTPQPAPSPFAFINPSDIESISILKDADATSIYGSRAANGAILITTKKGKAGQTAVNFNVQNGFGKATNKIELMNTAQYIQMRTLALQNTGLPPALVATNYLPTQYDINGLWDQSRYTDWQDVLLGGTAQYNDMQGSVSGGNTNTHFLVGAGYHRETTVFPGDHSDRRASLHFSLDNTSINQKFKFQLTGSYQFDKNNLPASDLSTAAIQLAPNAPSIYNPDGSLNWAPTATGASSWANPLSQFLNNTNVIKTSNLIANSIVSYQIYKGLILKSSFGYTNQQQDQINTTPSLAFAPENRTPNSASSRFVNNDISSWIIEPQLHYDKVIGKGKIQAIAGGTITRNNSISQNINASVFSSDQLLQNIGSASTITGGTILSTYKYAAVFGRANYNWDDKYIVNATVRRDGSSRFGAENQFHDFWSAAGAWIFSNEKIMKDNLSILSFGKLSASYGTTGNDQIPNYTYLATYNSNTGSSATVTTPYQGATGLRPAGLSNQYVQWETTNKLRFGLDLGFFKDRLLLTSNYFQNRSSNQLLGDALPQFVGFTSVTKNFPATVQNSGWEFTMNTINLQSKALRWTSSVNLTIPKNKLVSFAGLELNPTYANRLIVGQPVNIIKTYLSQGVNPTTGIYQYMGANGQLTTAPRNPTDLSVVQDVNPKFYGGFQNTVSYKGFQLDFLFQFVKQTGNNNYMRFGFLPGFFNGNIGNQPTTLLSGWQRAGDVSQVQGYGQSFLNPSQTALLFSDDAYTDASYIKLRNASLSWRLPQNWVKQMHLNNARLFMQGQNLLTVTNFEGPDPETQNAYGLSPLRVITFGVSIAL